MAANGILSPPAGPQLAGCRPHPSMPEPLGRVAHYELRRPLGAGGMGEVFLAHDTELQRPVAIKFLLGASGHDLEARQRLRHEAQAAAGLDRPNICSIYQVGTDELGRDFIAMQYVDFAQPLGPPSRHAAQRQHPPAPTPPPAPGAASAKRSAPSIAS